MSHAPIPATNTALLLFDLQNDFIHPDGAYARGGQGDPDITALPARLAPLANAMRHAGGWIASTHFTLWPGRGGEPIIAPHLKMLRPFLRQGDFAPGSWGQQLVEELGPSDIPIEKVAYSAFYMTRLEWMLRKCGIERLVVGGITTNGGVSTTVRDAHVRDIDVTVLSDGCATFGRAAHETAIAALLPVARVATVAEVMAELGV
ncbi:cysteine hydrolase [Roseomonas sp. KE2513]|uniref:cysteine hydrolase n=1 Tax=Roseomonas sp. KE2513 TaxID=2479202 RepID=UPI0018E00316|nr:cysteine hydrolase [Roseomonas sp. KE2513]MBI0534390.1 cysteine hydrolase [Roseomonas sp. KE2513]